MTPLLIESSAQMDELARQLSEQKLIAVDTEFQRETTYYPHLALVQIATDSIVACIDPLAFDAKPALQKILFDQNIIKVFHSCSQDLEVLFYYLGEVPSPIYDTQIANAFLTEQHQVSYAALVEAELGVLLDKSQTRTNWLRRPLTDKQIQYAGDDVLYLYQLHQILADKLTHSVRSRWFDDECANLTNNENSFQVDTDKLWRRVKEATKLNKSNLAIVQAIAIWREQLAQQKDKVRKKVLTDEIIINLAINPPENKNTIDQLIKNNYVINDNDKQSLFDVIENAKNMPADEWPDNQFSALDGQQKQLLKNLQKQVSKKAEELGIASAMLCSRKDLEQLILQKGSVPPGKPSKLSDDQNWRFKCIGQTLLETVKNIN